MAAEGKQQRQHTIHRYDMIWYDMMDYINVRPKADV